MSMQQLPRGLAIALLLAMAGIACGSGTSGDGSGESGGDAAGDAGPSLDGSAHPEATVGPDAGAVDATPDGEAGLATCNAIPQGGPVPLREKVASIPPAEGGAIADGLYFVVREASLSGGGFDELNHITWRITGAVMESNEQRVGKTSQRHDSYSLATSGTNLTRAMTCSSYGPGAHLDDPKTSGYTATPTKLTLFFGTTQLFELEKQP